MRARVAFYASTPAYRPAFEIWGLNELTDRLKLLAREQRWEEMPDHIDDDILNTFAVVGTSDEIAEKMIDRFSGVLTHVGFSTTVECKEDAERLKAIVARIQAA